MKVQMGPQTGGRCKQVVAIQRRWSLAQVWLYLQWLIAKKNSTDARYVQCTYFDWDNYGRENCKQSKFSPKNKAKSEKSFYNFNIWIQRVTSLIYIRMFGDEVKLKIKQKASEMIDIERVLFKARMITRPTNDVTNIFFWSWPQSLKSQDGMRIQ